MRHQDSDPTTWTALRLSEGIRTHEISCREVMAAFLERIEGRNPRYNAIVALRDRGELERDAKRADDELSAGRRRGWMHGLPLAVKDLAFTKGLVTTLGSPLMRDFVPTEDSLVVERMRAAGAIVIAKTNVPEFGLGSHTFNSVYGTTANAYDHTKTAGGSSGGAAVALATGMVPIADGSDFMGSLRNPAAFNNVIGFRPTQGRVPTWPAVDVYLRQLGTEGPMGRSVLDVAALLATQAGPDRRTPLALDDVEQFDAQTIRSFEPAGTRIAWLSDLDGHLATEPGILEVSRIALRRLETLGCSVEPISFPIPPEEVWEAWLVWRRCLVGAVIGPYVDTPERRARVKPEAIWEYDALTQSRPEDFVLAGVARTRYFQAITSLFERFDFLALPTVQVWPFDAAIRWPTVVAGRGMDTYHRWMESTIYATFGGFPAISVPAGFNEAGLPTGLQLIGRHRCDRAVLQIAHAYEATIDELRVGEA